jgi:hypothetical protein
MGVKKAQARGSLHWSVQGLQAFAKNKINSSPFNNLKF